MSKYDLGILKGFTLNSSNDEEFQSQLALKKLYDEGCSNECQYRSVLTIAFQKLYNKYPSFLLG